MNHSSRQLLQEITADLQPIYGADEARSIAFVLLAHLYGLSRSAILADKAVPVPDTALLNTAIERLKQHEPIQYVTGTTEFMGKIFEVNKHVLIPRPETEELVSLIIMQNKHHLPAKVLDIGTGSGCIAISLAAAWPDAQVLALDVSEDALLIARKNAARQDMNVEFIQASILDDTWQKETMPMQLDIVVSNPPYVTWAEEPLMRENVKGYEPHVALFVADTDPLLFYKYIARFCARHLKNGGLCYVEINEQYGEEVKKVFTGYGFTQTEVWTDMFGKSRFVKGRLLH
jgi:release factor glutamine methyltransferase